MKSTTVNCLNRSVLRALQSLLCAWLACAAAAVSAAPPSASSTSAASSPSSSSRPNIVLIVADDLGASDLACYGSTFHRTPRLDALARDGVRFTQAYAACPVCSPTRAAVMTGRAPARTGITDWLPGRGDRPDQKLLRPALWQQLASDEITIAELLKSAGYATGHIGKWHLGGEGFGPLQQGFDVNIAGDDTGSPLSYFAPYERKTPQGGLRKMTGLDDAPAGEYLTDRLGVEAERFIAAHADRPFFLYLPHYGVHTPMRAPEEMVAAYDPTGRKPGTQQNPIYAAMLESVDAAVGRVVDALAKHGLTENTLVIFTSDNGGLSVEEGPNTPATSNAPLREGKGYLYEGGLRVPLIVAGAGVDKPGRTDDTPVWSCDFFPTIAELTGLPQTSAADGVSLLPLLASAAVVERDALHWHYPHYANQGGKPGGAIRAGPWKLIEFYENGRRELFDLSKDPRESKNVAADHPDVVAELAKRLDAWRRDAGALMPTPNPDYVPHPQAKDGTVLLPGKSAEVFGSQLRFEPSPHKNTLGFWTNASDYAAWDFIVSKPGSFEVELLQGCGTGQGGSVVEIAVVAKGDDVAASGAASSDGVAPLSYTVEDTGHFQNFVPRTAGVVELVKPGRYRLSIRVRSKAAAAVVDVRQVTLRPTK